MSPKIKDERSNGLLLALSPRNHLMMASSKFSQKSFRRSVVLHKWSYVNAVITSVHCNFWNVWKFFQRILGTSNLHRTSPNRIPFLRFSETFSSLSNNLWEGVTQMLSVNYFCLMYFQQSHSFTSRTLFIFSGIFWFHSLSSFHFSTHRWNYFHWEKDKLLNIDNIANIIP